MPYLADVAGELRDLDVGLEVALEASKEHFAKRRLEAVNLLALQGVEGSVAVGGSPLGFSDNAPAKGCCGRYQPWRTG